MKVNVFLFMCLFFPYLLLCQNQNEAFNKYVLRYTCNPPNIHYDLKADSVLVKQNIKEEIIILDKSTGKVDTQEISKVIFEKQANKTKKDTTIVPKGKWIFSDVKFEDSAPNKLILNPYPFTCNCDSLLNNQCFIKIPANQSVTLSRHFIQWRAITIPFVFRPKIIDSKDTLGSKVTTDLKIGASLSYNYNREKFLNRRIKANRTVRGISGGIGFGLSKVTLDSASTSLAEKPNTKSEDGLAIFITPGIGLNLRKFQIDIFVGWDFGITDNTEKWNYDGKPYYGLGLGVDINTFTRRL